MREKGGKKVLGTLSPLQEATTAAPRRRWFRYSLRTLFVVVTMFGVWLGWQVKTVRTRQTMRAEIEASGGIFSSVGGNIAEVRRGDPNWSPPLIRRLLGDSAVFCIFFNRFTTPDDINRSKCFPEASVLEWADNFGGRRTYEQAERDAQEQRKKSARKND